MLQKFDFENLFVFDLANNHQGEVEHGLDIIKEVGAVARKHDVRGVFKFQFRQLDTFVHKLHKTKTGNKHIPRFLNTRLTNNQFQRLFDAARVEGLITMCTPFDEESVDVIENMGFDLVKVASCSAQDWPLLERVAQSSLPIIFSTGGLHISQIDSACSFFEHRGSDYAIMHCVSIYPTPPENCDLNQIDRLSKRFPDKVIGWSTHEPPDEMAPIQIAYAKGARMFERHVGIETDDIKLNAYSSTPKQLNYWIESWKLAVSLCGSAERDVNQIELESINSLRRGVYVKRPIRKGEAVSACDIYFAMPYLEGQLPSGSWTKDIVLKSSLSVDEPIMQSECVIPEDPHGTIIKTAVHQVKAMLNEAKIVLSPEFEVEYSHHYGIENFRDFGAILINCINRKYCKKIIVQLPGQKHPAHFHPRKEETFQLLHGEMNVSVEGRVRKLLPGDTCLILPGVWHSFWTERGCVAEEISTTHYNNDSVYKDHKINILSRDERKTTVDHWGRFQIYDEIVTPKI